MIDRFLDYIKVEKRYSDNTIVSYKRDLKDFISFLNETESTDDTLSVDKRIIRNFMVHLNKHKLAENSINRKLTTLRGYYNFLLKIGEIKVSPLESIKSLKFNPKKQIPLSVEEMERLSKLEFQGEHSLLEILIIETLYQTGMRRFELCNMELQNVDLSKNEIKISGKGNKTRVVPIAEDLSRLMRDYTEKERNPLEACEKYFFVSTKGKKITENFVYVTVNSYLSAVTCKEKKSPHILRHTFATHILNNGAEISKVKAILGHSSLASTQVYTNADIEQMKRIFNTSHPRAKKKN
ncbi:tyrosine-type recombinase/integrase [Bergeyella cardium]|uniref:tyrosine-type recombinase/integrase n=1 Tax=Bergeyella cardium TaxID=1585976 RepID=UPI000EA18249|nr:tyrosine-type recombinase/integrase [Bergeyella cardium]